MQIAPFDDDSDSDSSDEPTFELTFEQLRELAAGSLDPRQDQDLQPTTPDEALELYLESREGDCRQSTLDSHRSRLKQFVSWCAMNDVETLDTLGGRDLVDFKNWRRDDGNLEPASVKTQMDTLGVFLRFCGDVEIVPENLHEKVQSTTLSDGDDVRSVILEHDEAASILQYLNKYHYASREHAVWTILANTGMRTGGLRALELGDYDPDDPSLSVSHRPESGTAIKNGPKGERQISLTDTAAKVLDDYIDGKRSDVRDEYDREPLITTRSGRIAASTVRKYVYKWTRPCATSGECPVGKDPETCPAASSCDRASRCEPSVSPHAIRRGYMTHKLRQGAPKFLVSERCDVTEDVLDKHYDGRDEAEKMRQRESLLDRLFGDKAQYGEDTSEGGSE
jgi:site-specific recombinase XerD